VYNLSLHIEYLLLRHDCVVVPGVGAFINVRHAARRDAATGMWLPMTREVRFNSALSHDDGLLTSSYALKSSVTFTEARDMLIRDIRQLTDTLDTDGEVTIGHIGILRRTEETVTFTPRQTPLQLAARLGYGSVAEPRTVKTEANQVQSGEKRAEDSAKNNNTPASAANKSLSDSADASNHGGRTFDTRRNYYIAVNKVFARTAACLMIATVAALSLILPIGDRTREDQASVVPVEKIIRDTATRIASAVNERRDTTAADTIAAIEPEKQSEQATARFYAIVATFATSAEAERYIAQNAVPGYRLEVVNGRTKSRVSAISSDNRDELRSEMAKENFRQRFSEAWIWEDATAVSAR